MSYFIDFLTEQPEWFIAIWVALGFFSSLAVWQAISEARRDDDDA